MLFAVDKGRERHEQTVREQDERWLGATGGWSSVPCCLVILPPWP